MKDEEGRMKPLRIGGRMARQRNPRAHAHARPDRQHTPRATHARTHKPACVLLGATLSQQCWLNRLNLVRFDLLQEFEQTSANRNGSAHNNAL